MIALALAFALQMQATQSYDAVQGDRAHQQGREERPGEIELRRQQAKTRAIEEAMRADPNYALGARMVDLIRHGRCDEAYNLAVLAGHQEFADRARSMCGQTPKP